MARITYVKKAQQRYVTVPVLNEDGQPKTTPVMVTKRVRYEDGTVTETKVQKTDKHGRPVTMKVTVSDKSQPLPNRKCDKCDKEIEVGQPYKHISPKSGPYGGRTMYRCNSCPDWNVWEYSNSLSAQIERIVNAARNSYSEGESTASDVKELLDTAASEIHDLSDEKRESAQNIEDGFGHPTSASEDLNEIADALNSWADEIEFVDIPDDPEPEECDCCECDGQGTISRTGHTEEDEGQEYEDECEECEGTGRVIPDEPTEDQMQDWYNEVEDALSVLDDYPL